jgi:UDP-2-acetamido-3-amino-2,3-dideoxy-glucuronate N-acetyltransferase
MTTQQQSAAKAALPRVAVVGAGYWGKNLVRNFAALGALEVVVDADAATADKMVAAHGGRRAEFADVLKDRTIAGLVIAAPAAQHYALAKAALEAGKHVLVEKPLALELTQARELVALAARNDRRLMVGHLLQFHPAFLALKELVAQGRLGTLQYIYSNRLNFGLLRTEEDVLWSFAPHDISMILALAGSEPTEVEATGSTHLNPAIADIATVHMKFPGGLNAHVSVSWLNPFKEQKLVVTGNKAMAVFDDGEPWERKLVIYPHKVERTGKAPRAVKADGGPVALTQAEPLANECRHFLDCIASGATPRTDGAEGLRVLGVLARASASMAKRT